MTMSDDRATIANAANTLSVGLPGFNVTPNYRQTTLSGQGWVKWVGQARAENWFGFMNTWEVTVALPQDTAGADDWISTNLTTLVDALSTVMTVLTVAPTQLAFDDGSSVYAVQIQGALEA